MWRRLTLATLVGFAVALPVWSPALAAEKPVYSWKDTFKSGFEFFREIEEHPSRARAISTAQYAMIVRNDVDDFRICRLHYTEDGRTPVGVCEDIVWLDDLARGLNN